MRMWFFLSVAAFYCGGGERFLFDSWDMMMKRDNRGGSVNAQIPGRLAQLGWSSFFADQRLELEDDGVVARVIGVRKNSFVVSTATETLQATLAGRLHTCGEHGIPAVGDWVVLRDSSLIWVFQRRNALSRKASGARSRKGSDASPEQVLAANLDTVWIVCGLDRDFNPRRIERYLTLVYNCGIEPVVILTKADLHAHPDRFLLQVEDLAAGVPVFAVSAEDAASILQIGHLVAPGKTVALIGSSGAGKSTLINRLADRELQQTGAVGVRVGKGRHTTTSRDLIVLPGGGMIIDNPGIREIGLAASGVGMSATFPEIEEAAGLCRFRDCSHTREKGCAVLAAVAEGSITAERLESFRKLASELSYLEQRELKSAARVEKERWKEVALKVRSLKKKRY